MPPGAKKRKALKKKQQATVTSRNNQGSILLHGGNDEHGGSQDDRESDSNLSSPGSQDFGGTQDPSAAMVKDTATEISHVTQGLGPNSENAIEVETGTDKSPISSYENSTLTAKTAASRDPCVKEITPVVDSVSTVLISLKNDHSETATHSKLVIQKSVEDKEYLSTGLEKDNGEVATLPGPPAGTHRKVESVRESEVPFSSEEKHLLLPGPPAVRTSWLSCCGLFDAMTGSDR